MNSRWLVWALALIALIGFTASIASAERRSTEAYVGSVTIGGTRYGWADGRKGLALIKSSQIKVAVALLNRCPSVRGPFVFVRASKPAGIGLVMWAPAGASCTGVYGGGEQNLCLQIARTPANEDPTGVRPNNIPAPSQRSFVLIAGTNNAICTDLSTQVPGGLWATLNQSTEGGAIGRGRTVLVKCQTFWNGELWDYVAEYKPSLPSAKVAGWIQDDYVPTGFTAAHPNVPTCWGLSIRPGA